MIIEIRTWEDRDVVCNLRYMDGFDIGFFTLDIIYFSHEKSTTIHLALGLLFEGKVPEQSKSPMINYKVCHTCLK